MLAMHVYMVGGHKANLYLSVSPGSLQN